MRFHPGRLIAAISSLSLAAMLATTVTAQPPEGGPRGQGGNKPVGAPEGGGPNGGGPMRGEPTMVAKMLMEKFDKDGDKMLNSDELVAALTAMRQMGGPGGVGGGPGGPGGPMGPGGPGDARGGEGGPMNASRMFEQRDADHDGKLTGDEIPERMRQNMARVDTNNDGAIDKPELEKLMSSFGGPGGPGGNRPPRDGQPGGDGDRPRRPPAE